MALHAIQTDDPPDGDRSAVHATTRLRTGAQNTLKKRPAPLRIANILDQGIATLVVEVPLVRRWVFRSLPVYLVLEK